MSISNHKLNIILPIRFLTRLDWLLDFLHLELFSYFYFLVLSHFFQLLFSALVLLSPGPSDIRVWNVPEPFFFSLSCVKPHFSSVLSPFLCLSFFLSFYTQVPGLCNILSMTLTAIYSHSQWCHRLEAGPHSEGRGTADNGSLIQAVNSWWDDSCNKGSDDSLQAESVKRVSVWLERAGTVILFKQRS